MTSDQAQVYWQAMQRAVSLVHVLRQPPAWRRRRCGEMRVTITERRAMQAFYLINGESYTALAKRFRRDRHYMRRWIWDGEFRAFYAYYWGTDGSAITGRSAGAAGADARPTAA